MGDKLVRNASETDWSTQHGGVRVQAIYRELTLTAGFSITGSGNTVQAPWGSFPGYLSLTVAMGAAAAGAAGRVAAFYASRRA